MFVESFISMGRIVKDIVNMRICNAALIGRFGTWHFSASSRSPILSNHRPQLSLTLVWKYHPTPPGPHPPAPLNTPLLPGAAPGGLRERSNYRWIGVIQKMLPVREREAIDL